MFRRRALSLLVIAGALTAERVSRSDEGRPASGFQLVALSDLIYIPEPTRTDSGHLGACASGKETAAGDLFRVVRNGKGAVDGLFNVGGRPLAPIWKSSDRSVLTVCPGRDEVFPLAGQRISPGKEHTIDTCEGRASFRIRGPGKTTVTVSVGEWSEHRELEVVRVPLAGEMPPHEILKRYGYPAVKYKVYPAPSHTGVGGYPRQKREAAPTEASRGRLPALPEGCYQVAHGCGGLGVGTGNWNARECEFWEYSRWPRCILVIYRYGEMGELAAVLTRPANADDAKGSERKRPEKPEPPNDGESANSTPATGRVSRGDEGPFPRPARDAIAKAKEKAREVYKADLAKANQPSEKAALARELLTAADGVGQDDASRLVLLTMARDLAVDADDASLAVKAVAAMVRRFQPDGPADPKEQIERGNAPWKEAETASADKRLRLKVQAAEWYLRAKPATTGLDKTMIEKRLAELGGADTSGGQRAALVAIWEHYVQGRNGRHQPPNALQLFSDGNFKAARAPAGPSTWEKKGSTLILRWGSGSVDTCALSKDGRSYDGHNQQRTHVWGKLLSEQPMPE